MLPNKTAKIASVRIPRWVDRAKVTVQRSDRPVEPAWSGTNLLCTGLAVGEVVTLSSPVRERIEKAVLCGTEYTFPLRGITVVSVVQVAPYMRR